MKKYLALVLSLLLLLVPVLAAAEQPEAFSPEAFRDALQAEIEKTSPELLANTTIELNEEREIIIICRGVAVAKLYFDHIGPDDMVSGEGTQNHLVLLIPIPEANVNSVKLCYAYYTIFASMVRHILYPASDINECFVYIVDTFDKAISSGTGDIRSATEEDGVYRETILICGAPADAMYIGYEVRIIGLS